jgi:hypothetical protein
LFFVGLMLFCASGQTPAQQTTSAPPTSTQPQNTTQVGTSAASTAGQSSSGTLPEAPPPQQIKPKPPPQPKRILGVMPNYRAVSAGEKPPPPTPKEAFTVATRNSFDYSAFVFVGVTSLLAEGDNAHPQLGKGVGGYWGYYWRGVLDKTDGNYMVDWAFPTITHEDERYYAKGVGSPWKRSVYAATRVFITPDYHGKDTFNASEVVGRGVSQAISLTYYPSATRSVSGFSSKYAYALGRDAVTNVFRELWPDVSAHVFHRHQQRDAGLSKSDGAGQGSGGIKTD